MLKKQKHTLIVTLFSVFIIGLLGGFLTLLTPCVWPSIPLTVSFFLKRGRGWRDAVLYGVSIFLLFVGFSLIVTLLFGANTMNNLSTNAVFNIACCIVLVVLGLSLCGLFELTLPDSWAQRLDDRAVKTTGFISIFLMALTLVVVSFSCTAPIVGMLLAEIATNGKLLSPVIGMSGFALALALPFTLFALFPKYLSSLPRSGEWMQRLRFALGIIEIAFALKFFSIADQAYGWNMLSPTLFLIIWALLALILTARFLWKPKGANQQKTGSLTTHLLLAIVPFLFAIYLIQGIFTKETTLVSAFLPMEIATVPAAVPCDSPQSPATVPDASASGPAPLFHDYDEGVAYATKTNKRIFLNFTGYGCVNCRKMEATVLKDAEVQALLRNYVIIELYVDDRSPVPAPAPVPDASPSGSAASPATVPDGEASGSSGSRRYHELGEKWADLEATRFHSVSQPLYVILSPQGEQLKAPIGYTPDVQKFIDFLK